MKTAEPTVTLLDGGLRLVHIHRRTSGAGIFGIAVRAGSADERPGEEGLAHFVEHTIFKGTRKRSSWHIINRMEAVGGELNAYTTKEETVIYSIFPSGNAPRAIELIADLAINSQCPDRELEKEREVVIDEINSYRDTPSELIYDDFEDMVFAGSQLGHNILGSADTLAGFSSEGCRRWIERNYTAGRMTAFYYGAVAPARVCRALERLFGDVRCGASPRRTAPAPVAVFGERRRVDSQQANTVVGARVGGIYSPDRHALALVVNILGGPGMNSRLNVALRERRGLVYSVEASLTRFTDCGLFTVYYGCDPADNDRCLELVRTQLRVIAERPLTPAALRAAKKQFLGQVQLSAVNVEQTVMNAARSVMFRGEVAPAEELVRRVEAVTDDDVMRVAADLRPECCSWLTLG